MLPCSLMRAATVLSAQFAEVGLISTESRHKRRAALTRCEHVRRECIVQLLHPLRERAVAAAAIRARGYQHDERRPVRGREHCVEGAVLDGVGGHMCM